MARPEDKTIPVVDDEPDIVTFLSTALEESGFEVVTAADGVEALERIKEKVPDFISLDLVMPGKSGIRLFHELRRNKAWAKIPVMVVTGHAREHADELTEITSARTITGPSLYLEKPIKAPRFVQAVAQALGVELPDEVEDGATDNLRAEARSLLDEADPAALAAALALLKKQKQ